MLTPYEKIVRKAEELLANKQYQQALDLYDLALTTNPEDPHLRYCVASLYSELYKSGIAISILKGVVKDIPKHAQAWNNLGIAYKNSGQWDKAYEAYMKSLELNYDAQTIVNLSGLYINNGTPEDAIKWSEKGLKLQPGSPQLRNHRALGYLESGRLKEGFEQYEARFNLPGWSSRDYAGPLWKGEHVETLLIHGEQGLGDELLFLTAFERARKRVGKVIIECAHRLTPLLQANLDAKCYSTAEEIKASGEKWDAWIPMGSLFKVVGWHPSEPYLKPTKPYPKGDRFRIGVSWRGGTVQTHEHLRNFELEKWAKLFNHDAEFISVQYGPAAGMAKSMGLPHDQPAVDDFELLTAMIASCDLIISVCNTTVHQAAVIGTPCWVLVPSRPSWQFQMTGDKMPFWAIPRLFRQGHGEDWSAVIQRIKSELEHIGIAEKRKAA